MEPLLGLLRPPGGLLGRKARIVGSCSPSWALLWAVLGPSWEPFRPSWGSLGGLLGRLGTSEARKGENHNNIGNTFGKHFWIPLGTPLGPLVGRLESFLSRLGAILGVLERSFGDSGPSWTILGASWGPSWLVLGPSWLRKSNATTRDAPQEAQDKPHEICDFGAGLLKDPQD